MATLEIVPGLRFADRDEWGVQHPMRGHKVDRDRRTHVIIHHTVMPPGPGLNNLWEDEDDVFLMMRRLEVVRAPDLGKDVPYNFVCFLMKSATPKMIVCEGREVDRTGAHTKGHNSKAIGIAFAGDFDDLDTDLARYVSLFSIFLGWLKFDLNHPRLDSPREPMSNLGILTPTGRRVFAHSDFGTE